MGHDSFGGHMGFKRTKARISYTFYWPGLREDCLRYVETCVACQMKARVTYRDRGYLLNRYQGQIVYLTTGSLIVLDHFSLLKVKRSNTMLSLLLIALAVFLYVMRCDR